MQTVYVSAAVALVSGVLLLFTAHPVWFFALVLSSVVAGYSGMEARYGDSAEV